MKKLILFLILFLIPSFCYASTTYEDLGFYTPIGTDLCNTNGKFVYNLSDGWEPKVGTKNSIYSTKNKAFMFYIKRDLQAMTTYDIKITATNNIFFQAINENSIRFYDVDTDCSIDNFTNSIESSSIALVSLSNKASTGNYVSSITIRLMSTTVHTNWILYIRNPNYKNITNTNWGIKNMQYKEVDMTGTNAIIENNTVNNNNLINNQNQNTQDIIDNNNKNTQDIIDNQNANNQALIDSNKVCDIVDSGDVVLKNKYLNNSGTIGNSNYYGVTDYININGATIDIQTPFTSANTGTHLCYYTENQILISCENIFNLTSLNIPSNAYYLRSTIFNYQNNNTPIFKICKNGNQASTDVYTDSSIPSGNDYFDDFNDMLPSNNTISSLVGLPITLYTKILNSINGTCSSINLGNLYGTDLIMPCINIGSYLGNTLWSTIDLIMSGAFVLIIAKKMIKAFEHFTSLKEGDVINND